jgi:hypothetical protein
LLLNPKKAKRDITSVAKELGIPESVVKDVVDFYWREVRRNLSSLSYPRIHIANLGDFTIKHWKLDDIIDKHEKFEESNRQKGLQQITARFKTAENLFQLKKMKRMIDDEKDRKEFAKVEKQLNNEIKQRKHNKDLEE